MRREKLEKEIADPVMSASRWRETTLDDFPPFLKDDELPEQARQAALFECAAHHDLRFVHGLGSVTAAIDGAPYAAFWR